MLQEGASIEEMEKGLERMIYDNPNDAIKYKKAFFALVKDVDLELAIKYAEDVIKEEQDPKFMKVLAVRYKRAGDNKKYEYYMDKKIPLLELQQTIQNFIDTHESFETIEAYIRSFKNEHTALENMIDKVVFSKLKDIYTKEVLPYGEAVVSKEYDVKFIKVLATRYKRVGDQRRHDELLAIIT